MANGAFKFKDNSGNVVSFISGSGSDIIISGGTLDLSGMSGLTLGNVTLSGTTQNAVSTSHAASYLLTSSFNSYSGTTDTVIGSLQTSTSSLNTFTSSANSRLNSIEGVSGSYATTGSNIFVGNQSITGSLTVSGSSTFTNIGPAIFSGSVTVPDITIDRAYGSNNNGDPIIIIRNTNAGNGITFNPNESDNFIEMSTGGTITAKGLTVSGSVTAPDIIVERTYGSNNNGDPIIIIKNSSLGNGITFNPNESGNIIQMNTDGTISAKGLTVTGFIEAQELRTTYISSSILYRSGSTKFGDELSDTHVFTGSLLISGSISVPGQNLTTGTGNGAYGQVVYFSGNNTIDGTSAFSWNSPTFTIGLSDSSNNIDYKTLIHRHGTLANPGTWTDSVGLQIVDYASDGPPSFQATSLVSIELPRINTSDTYAGNAVAFRVATDDATVLAVKGNGTIHLGQNGSVDSNDRLQVVGSAKITGFITAASTNGSGLRIYGSSGTNQWDMYLNGANIRFSDNTGTGGIVFDRPFSGTSATFSSSVSINTDVDILRFGNLLRWGFQRPASDNRYVSFVRNANATATPVWTVDGDNGFIGIGTNTPEAKLTIDGTSSGAYIRINNASSGDVSSGLLIYNGSNLDASIYTNPTFGNTTFLSREALAIRAGGSQRVFLSSVGDLSVGTGSSSVGGAPGSTNGRLNILTGNGSSAWAQQIRHDSTTGNGLFLRAGDSAAYWTAYLTGYDESKVHLAVRGDGRIGMGTNNPLGTLHVTSDGITPNSPSLGWPVYNAEADTNARRIYFDTGGNNLTSTAGSGATVALVLGQYYDSRAVITTVGSGGASPGDQGTGHGKDLMIKGGQSDNGIGYKGGRLYLSGGMGYTATGYNGNVGNIIMQPFGGNIGVGTDSPSQKLEVNGFVQSQRFYSSTNYFGFFPNYGNTITWEIGSDASYPGMYFYNASGGYVFRMTVAGSATFVGGVTSDIRTKENIQTINNNAIDFINELKPVSYEFIGDVNRKTRRGFIAQDVLETSIPSLVLGNGEEEGGTYGLDYDGILALSVKAIQEQQQQIEDLKLEIQNLKNN